MSCSTLNDCAAQMAEAISRLADQAGPSPVEWLIAGCGVVIAAFSAFIAVRVFNFDRSRVLRDDREALRKNLRFWFQALSRSAGPAVAASRGRLRSECEEIADAEGAIEILALMVWAEDMLNESYRRIDSAFTSTDAHLRRIIVKRRFRQSIAVWSRRPRAGRKLIREYTARGWAAIAAEPVAAATSAQRLASKDSWRKLPASWAVGSVQRASDPTTPT